MNKREWASLFSKYDLRVVLETQAKQVSEQVAKLSTDQIAQNDTEPLVTEILKQLYIEPLFLREDDISVDSEEAKVDVSQDFNRDIFDRSQPVYLDGIRVTYYVPLSGDPVLLHCCPNTFTYNHPRAVTGQGELQFPYDRADQNVESTKLSFQEDLNRLRQWLPWVNQQVEEFSNSLRSQIEREISARRQRLSEGQQKIDALGFKIKPKSPVSTVPVPEQPNPSRSTSTNQKQTPADRIFDVALSFAGEDRTYVEEVAKLLKQANVSVFYDGFEEVDLWGKNLADHLAEVYSKKSRFVVMFVSHYYAAKVWPNYERQQAQARALKNRGEYVLPARFDDTEVPGLPDSVAYVDLRKLTPQELVNRILAKLNRSS
jgi:hypothetical protein